MDLPVCKLRVWNFVLIQFVQAEYQKINKHPKFDDNFNIWHQLEHFEYEMNRALVSKYKSKTVQHLQTLLIKYKKVLAHPYNFQIEF